MLTDMYPDAPVSNNVRAGMAAVILGLGEMEDLICRCAIHNHVTK